MSTSGAGVMCRDDGAGDDDYDDDNDDDECTAATNVNVRRNWCHVSPQLILSSYPNMTSCLTILSSI